MIIGEGATLAPGPWRAGYVLPGQAAPVAKPSTTKAAPLPKAKASATSTSRKTWGLIMIGAAIVGGGIWFLSQKKRPKRRNPRRRPVRSNPAGAADFYREFHWGREPENVKRVKVSRSPKHLTELGTLEAITYSTTKGKRGRLTDFVHDFEGRKPVLAADPRTKRLHIIGGSYTIEDRGIVG